MGTREPLWQDVVGIVLGVGSILFGLTPRPTLPYPAGDIRATPEFGVIFTAIFVGVGAIAVVGFAIRLVQGIRAGR